jgi:tetratricopeptide (TPR) repeat protein
MERWDEARDLFLELAAQQPSNIDYTGYLGVIHARLGDIDAASTIANQLSALGETYLHGANTKWRARVAALLGAREQAVELLRRALKEGLPYDIWLHWDIDFEPLRNYAPYVQLMRPKG